MVSLSLFLRSFEGWQLPLYFRVVLPLLIPSVCSIVCLLYMSLASFFFLQQRAKEGGNFFLLSPVTLLCFWKTKRTHFMENNTHTSVILDHVQSGINHASKRQAAARSHCEIDRTGPGRTSALGRLSLAPPTKCRRTDVGIVLSTYSFQSTFLPS